MNLACTSINKRGIVIDKSLLFKNIHKYNGILGRAMYTLYDWGYQSSPALFDSIELMNVLNSDFKSELHLLRNNMRGKIELTDELMVRYAIAKSKDDSFKELLTVYLDILVSQEALKSFNKLVSRIKIPKKSNIINIKPRLGVSGSVHNYNVLPLDNKAIQECFLLEEDEELVVCSTDDILIRGVMEYLGYSDSDYLEHKNSGQPFFISGVSQEEELLLLPIAIDGKIVADGKYGKELTESIKTYYNEFYSNHDARIHCLRFEEVIFNSVADKCINVYNSKRESFKDKPFREFYVTSYSITFAVKSDRDMFPCSYFKNNKISLGTVTLNHNNRTEFSKINTLCGLCGEFIHENTVLEKGWYVEGLPVKIKFGMLSGKKFRLSELSYYPICNVYYSENGANIKPLLGSDIHILVSDFEDVTKRLGVSSKNELFNMCYKMLDVELPNNSINRVKYEELVSDLATALIYAECGELEYTLIGSDYTWVNDDIFYRASIEAELLFKRLGF